MKPPLTAPAQVPEPTYQERAASLRISKLSNRIAELERWESFLLANHDTIRKEVNQLEKDLDADENQHPSRHRPLQMRLNTCLATVDAIERGIDPRGLAGGDYAALARAAGFHDFSERPSLNLTQKKLEAARDELEAAGGVMPSTPRKRTMRHTTESIMERRRKKKNLPRGPR